MKPTRKSRPFFEEPVVATNFGPPRRPMQDDHRERSAEAPTLTLSKLLRSAPPRRPVQKKNSDQSQAKLHHEHFTNATTREPQLFVKFPASRPKTFAVPNEPEEGCCYETRSDVNEATFILDGLADIDFDEFIDDNDSDSNTNSCSSCDTSDDASSNYSDDNERSTDVHSEEYSEDCGDEKSSCPAYALDSSLDRVEQVFLLNEAKSPSPRQDDDKNSINHNSNNPFAAGFDFALSRPVPPKAQSQRSRPFCAIKFEPPKQERSIDCQRRSSMGSSVYSDGHLPKTFHFPRRYSLPDIFAPLDGEEIGPEEDPVKAVIGLKPYSRGMEDQVFAAFQQIAQNMARHANQF
jgi:hypothetical protein